jgi:hypothetical protein
MDVHIDEVVAEVRAVDHESLLSVELLGKIVRAVLAAQEAAAREREWAERDRRIECSTREADW